MLHFFIAGILCCITLSSATADTADRYHAVRLLQVAGPINWVPYAGTAPEREILFGILSGIAADPTGLNLAIQKRALYEAGKFATDSSGNMLPGAESFYQNQISNLEGSADPGGLSYSLAQSLENAFAPESTTLLVQLAQSQEGPSSQFAVQIFGHITNPAGRDTPPLPNTDERRFDVRPSTPLAKRLRPSDWVSATQAAILSLKKVAGRDSARGLNGSVDEAIKNATRFINEKNVPVAESGRSIASVSSQNPIGNLSQEKVPKQSATIAAEQNSRKMPHLGWVVFILGAGFVVLFSLILIVRK